MKENITEESGVHKTWYDEAKKQTPKTISEFIRHLTEDYDHDYGTICHACVAAALGAIHSIDNSDQGGITGFQAGAIQSEFIVHWGVTRVPARIQSYDDLLYPQYEDKFSGIPKDVWEDLVIKARTNLKEKDYMVDEVRKHMESISNGVVPFGLHIYER